MSVMSADSMNALHFFTERERKVKEEEHQKFSRTIYIFSGNYDYINRLFKCVIDYCKTFQKNFSNNFFDNTIIIILLSYYQVRKETSSQDSGNCPSLSHNYGYAMASSQFHLLIRLHPQS